jgi:LmbE family N-acetylglucosaminyl deacetylase
LFFRSYFINANCFTVTSGSILIVSPHPDDETFGCGGLISLKKSLHTDIFILFLTNGEKAHRGCCDTSVATIAAARLQCAKKVCCNLGICPENLIYLGLPDGAIPDKEDEGFGEAVDRLAATVSAIAPKEIYVTAEFDCWPDHARAARLTKEAVRRWAGEGKLFFYPIWMWHNLRLRDLGLLMGWQALRLDIRPVREKKQTAIKQYLAAINPGCGVPYCGNLPSGFLNPFHKDYEIFFQQSEGGRP